MARRIGRSPRDLKLAQGTQAAREELGLSRAAPTPEPQSKSVTVGAGSKAVADILSNESNIRSLRLAASTAPEDQQNSLESLLALQKTRSSSVPELFTAQKIFGSALDTAFNPPATIAATIETAKGPVGKFVARTAIEVGIGQLAAGPVGAATALTRSVGRGVALRAGERIARGVVRAAPNIARVGGGEAIGSLVAETFDPTGGEFDLQAAAERAAVTGLVGGTAELLVPGFSDAFNFLRNGGFQLVDGARPVVDKLMAEGAQVASPGFFSNSRFIQILDNIGSGSFFGGGKLAQAKRGGAEFFDDEVGAFMNAFQTFARGTIEVEKLAKDLILNGADAFRLVAKKKYGVIDELVGGGFNVDLNPLIKQLKTMEAEFGGGGATKILSEIDRIRGFGKVSDLNTVTFQTAADIRSKLLGLSREGNSIFAGEASKFGKRTSPTVTEQMEKAFKFASKEGLITEAPEALIKRWKSANEFWKEGVGTFNTGLMARLAGESPSGLINAARNSPGAMRIMRNTIEGIEGKVLVQGKDVTGKQVWEQVQGQLLLDQATKALGRGEVVADLVDGAKVVRAFKQKRELMEEAFGKEGFENVLNVFEHAALVQGKGQKKGLPGKMWIQLSQGTALAAGLPAAAGVFIGLGGAAGAATVAGFGLIMFGPLAAASKFSKKSFTKWLLQGTDETITAEKRIRAMTQLVVLAREQGFVIANTSQGERARAGQKQWTPGPAFLGGPQQP